MNKKVIYLTVSLCAVILAFFVGYSIYYNQKDVRQDPLTTDESNPLVEETEDKKSPTLHDAKDTEPIVELENNPIEVDALSQERITPSTKLIIQHYYINEDRLIEEELIPPYYLIDLTREQLEKYTHDYLESPTEGDIHKEIMSFELISFSSNQVVLRKVFNGEYDGYYQVYIDPEKEKIVIENPDGSIREDIDTHINSLPQGEIEALQKPGKKVYSEEDLLELIENYST